MLWNCGKGRSGKKEATDPHSNPPPEGHHLLFLKGFNFPESLVLKINKLPCPNSNGNDLRWFFLKKMKNVMWVNIFFLLSNAPKGHGVPIRRVGWSEPGYAFKKWIFFHGWKRSGNGWMYACTHTQKELRKNGAKKCRVVKRL